MDESNLRWVKASEATKFYCTSISNLRKWARENAISVKQTPGGHYLYAIPIKTEFKEENEEDSSWNENIIYTRVSSRKQRKDLERQTKFLMSRYPTFTSVKDIGSGLNYKRKGFQAILERLFQGHIKRVVVAHKDRFVRFGFDFFEWLFQRFGAVLECVEKPDTAPREDIVDDIMEVFTSFTARYYGSRKYAKRDDITKVPLLSESSPESILS